MTFTVNAWAQAIMESQNNPMAIMKYQDDPDVMLVRPNLSRALVQSWVWAY